MIESLNNDKVKYWTKLNEKKYQKEEGLFIIEGEHLIIEAEKILCSFFLIVFLALFERNGVLIGNSTDDYVVIAYDSTCNVTASFESDHAKLYNFLFHKNNPFGLYRV